MPPAPRGSHRLLAAGLSSVGCVVLIWSRFYALPKTFWEWDDYIFGLSLHVFAPQASVPQPPFFPGFVLLGRIARLLTKDDVLALTSLSAFASSMSPLLVFAVALELFRKRRVAVAAAILFAVTPAAWFHSGIPGSDAVGLAAGLFVLWLSLRAIREPSRLPIASAAMGLACSLRPQSALIAAIPLALAFAGCPASVRVRAFGAGLGFALFSWVAPVVAAAHGIAPVIRALTQHAHDQMSFTVFSTRPSLSFLVRRWLIGPWVTPAFAWTSLALAALGFGALYQRRARREITMLLIAFGPYLLMAWVFLDANFSGRYALPYLPLVAMLAAVAITSAKILPWGGPLLLGALAFWSANLTIPAMSVMRRTAAPPEAAAHRIRALAHGERFAVLYPADLYVHAELLFAGVPKMSIEKARSDPSSFRPEGGVFRFGVPSLNDPAQAVCWPGLEPFVAIAPGRYLRIPYGRWDGDPIHFGSGWFAEETEAGPGCSLRVFRWMGNESTAELPPVPGASDLELSFFVPRRDLAADPAVAITLNGQRLSEFVARADLIDEVYHLLPGTLRSDRRNELKLHTSQTFTPSSRGGSDRRWLGLQVRRLRIVTASAGAGH